MGCIMGVFVLFNKGFVVVDAKEEDSFVIDTVVVVGVGVAVSLMNKSFMMF